MGTASLWFITVGYPGYEKKFHRSLDLNFLLSNLMKSASGTSAVFKEVEIKEKDAKISQAQRERFGRLKGYAYLNALFFARHRRQLVKPVYYRLAAVATVFAGAVLL